MSQRRLIRRRGCNGTTSSSISGPRARGKDGKSPTSGRKSRYERETGRRSVSAAELEHREEGLLRHLDAPDLLHPLLAFLLLLEQLALARDVAAVALRDHVLAEGLDRLARDHVRSDRRLDRHVVLLTGDLRPQPLGQHLAELIGLVAVHDHRERIDWVAAEQHVELDEVRRHHPCLLYTSPSP